MAVDVALDRSVALGRDDGGGAPGVEIGQDGVGVVALVPEQHPGLGSGLGHERGVTLDVGYFAAGQHDGDGQAEAVRPQMDLGREATARAPKTFAFRA